jgi:Xaa-Pro aminopeptidase
VVSISERIICPISSDELQRRWRAVRLVMEAAGIEALLIHASTDYLGGYVKWFTDIPATTGYPTIVVFPLQGEMTIISQGQWGLDRPPPDPGPYRGVGRMLGAPGYASAAFTSGYEAKAVEKALAPYADAAIGLVGWGHVATTMDHLRGARPDLRFVPASDLIDAIKARKSEEELALIRRTAAMQDRCMEAVAEALRPGLTDIELGGIVERVGRALGSEQGIFLVASGPVGQTAVYGIRHYQGRTIERGDYVNVLVENNGPGGFYTEIGRTFVLGKANQEMRDDFALMVQAQVRTIEQLCAGASNQAVWESHNGLLAEHGKPAESRLYCHSQGYDLVERPLVRFDDELGVDASMSIACHPTIVTSTNFSSCCDNFLIGDGSAERLHTYPQTLIEL